MQTTFTIKKSRAIGYQDKPWHVARDGGNGFYACATVNDAIKLAYEYGATEVRVHYSNTVMRIFSRQALENFNLVATA